MATARVAAAVIPSIRAVVYQKQRYPASRQRTHAIQFTVQICRHRRRRLDIRTAVTVVPVTVQTYRPVVIHRA